MHGDVFGPWLNIPKVVGWSLVDVAGKPRFAIQNLAEPGTSLSLGLPSQLYPIFQHPARYRAAALLIYVGHNEYWNARIYGGWRATWWSLSPDAEREAVESTYERRMRRLLLLAQAARVPVFLGLPVGNQEGFPPVEPRHRWTVTWGDRTEFEREIDVALRALAASRPDLALRAALAARDLSPQHGWAAFVEGRALRALGRPAAAHAAFRRAHEQDYNRQRALPSQNAILRRLCAEGLAHCVDAEAAMRAELTWLDDDAFIDLHHPDARGHALIGAAFARSIATTLDLPPPRRLPPRGWPKSLDPSPAMRARYLQTAAWHLVLANDLRHGYRRSQQAVVTRARRQLVPLRRALQQLPTGPAAALRPRVQRAALVAAALAGEVAEARRLRDIVWREHDWCQGQPLATAWMRDRVADVLGPAAVAPRQPRAACSPSPRQLLPR